MRLGHTALAFLASLSIAFSLLALAAPSAQACGLFGLFCSTREPPAPDPGGQESPDQPVPAVGKWFGFNSQLSMNGLATADQELDAATVAGATAHRLPVVWRALQPEPSDPPLSEQPYLEKVDAFYAAAIARGVLPVFITYWAPVWASKYRSCRMLDFGCIEIARSDHKLVPDQPFLNHYRRFVTAVKQRWPRAIIEPWNEPNAYWDDPEYRGSKAFAANPEEFAAIQCAAYAGSKAVNDDPVLASGWGARRYGEYLSRIYAAGGKDCWDRANLHLYPGESSSFGRGTYIARVLSQTRGLRAKYGDGDPLWITETGYTTSGFGRVAEDVQADGFRRLYNRFATMPDIEAIFVHTLRDSPLPRYPWSYSRHGEYGFGFLRENWTPKPVYCQFARQAGNAPAGC